MSKDRESSKGESERVGRRDAPVAGARGRMPVAPQLGELMDSLGNRGVLALMRARAGAAHPDDTLHVRRKVDDTVTVRRKCACGSGAGAGSCLACLPDMVMRKPAGVHAKMMLSEPEDPAEQHADRVADEVMRMADPVDGTPPVDLGPPPAPIQRKSDGAHDHGGGGGGESEARVRSLRGGGRPLPEAERAFFEPRLGRDLAGVRVHTDGGAAQLARDLGARAFTHERDIVFASGQWRPGTSEGRRLLAHELTHVAQGGDAPPAGNVYFDRDENLAEYLRRLRELAPRISDLSPEEQLGRIHDTLRGVHLLDTDNLTPITEVIAQHYPGEVLVLFVNMIDQIMRGTALARVDMRGRTIGLFHISGAIAHTIVRAATSFYFGVKDGMRETLTEAQVEAFTHNLALSGVITAVAPPVFAAGAIHGVGRDVYRTVTGLVEFIGNWREMLTMMGNFVAQVLSDPAAAYAFGYGVGVDLAREIQRMGASDPVSFTYRLGMLVGPIIIYTIISFLGLAELAAATAFVRIANTLRRFPRFAAFAQSAARFFRRRVHPALRGHVPDPDAPTPHPRPDAPERRPGADPDAPGHLPAALAGACSIGSLRCSRIPQWILDLVGDYPHPDRCPRPGGPYTLRGTTDAAYLTLRAVTGEQLRAIYLNSPRVWTREFREAWTRINRHLGQAHIDNVLAGRASARGSSWPMRRGRPWEVHHRRPLDFGGDNTPGNLVALEPDIHVEFTSWWRRIKSRVRRSFIDSGQGGRETWRRIIGGEEDVVYQPPRRPRGGGE